MKQTAVEWLVDKLIKGEFINSTDELIEQAKQMEKQQIVNAYYQCGRDNFEHIKVINRSATDYYNETYKQ